MEKNLEKGILMEIYGKKKRGKAERIAQKV